ncbi:MAG: PepSY-associated TM helix domain-containing protein [Armatimonadota bacterium]
MFRAPRTRQVYLWHKWTGLITGLFIFFVSLTGTLAVFKNEIDAAMTPGKQVKPAGTRAPLEQIVTTMREAYPESRVGQINLAAGPGDVHSLSIKDGKRSREVFIDPYTAAITGSRTGENLANVIRQTHLRFYYFKWQGRVFVGVVGLALLISTITGFMIYGPFMKNMVFGQIRWKHGPKIVLSDWHKLVGIVTLAFNLVFGLTGAVLGLENLARFSPPVSEALHPKPEAANRKLAPETVEGRLTVDEAVQKAQVALPGFEATSVTLPRAEKSHWMLRGNLRGHFAARGTSWALLDTHTGMPIEVHDARRARPVTWAYNLSEPLHFGDFAGLPLKVVYGVAGLLGSSLYLTGFVIWLYKRRKKKPTQDRPAVPPSPTASSAV